MAIHGKRDKRGVRFPVFSRLCLFVSMALALSLGPILASAAQASESGVEAVSSPLNIEATLSQVKVLKANGEYKKAASILDALVKEMEPGAARAGLKVMEARFLAWSKDYDNAVKL